MGRKPERGGVRPKGDRIEVRFMWQGKQIAPTLDLKPTAANLRHAARQREQIVQEVAQGTFTFAKYFPDYRYREKHQSSKPEEARALKDWYDVWAKLAARELEHSTLTIYKRHMKRYWLAKFGERLPGKITYEDIMEHLADLATDILDEETGNIRKGLSRKTQNNICIPLRAVFALICKPPSQISDPTEGLQNLKVQKGNPDPFTASEVEAILKVLRDKRGDEMADYFEFSIFAGLRSSEQIALLWPDADLRSNTVMVRRAMVMTKEKDRTKTHVERTVELNARAGAVLHRQRARTQALGAHVFRNPVTGKPFADEQAQRLAWKAALRSAGVRYRPPKECRDTSVTLALMAGANPVWVAAQHGHSVQVMLKSYAKWIPSADRGSNLAAVNASLKMAARRDLGLRSD